MTSTEVTYEKLTYNNNKVQVDSAIRDGNGAKIDTTYQTKLTFDSAPTANSTNPVTSGGVKTALDDKLDDSQLKTSWSSTVSDSNIPSEKLTKDSLDAKVDSSKLGTTSVRQISTLNDEAYNNRMVVYTRNLSTGNDDLNGIRFRKINGEYIMQAGAQFSSELSLAKTDLSNVSVSTDNNDKALVVSAGAIGYSSFQAPLTFDNIPTANSTNPVTSGGVKTALGDGSVTKVGTSTVGGSTTPIYLSSGVPTQGTALSDGAYKAMGSIASGNTGIVTGGDIYTALTDGSVTKVGTSTVGGTTTPIYLNAGVPTAGTQLGDGAFKNMGSVSSGNTGLVTGGDVYTAVSGQGSGTHFGKIRSFTVTEQSVTLSATSSLSSAPSVLATNIRCNSKITRNAQYGIKDGVVGYTTEDWLDDSCFSIYSVKNPTYYASSASTSQFSDNYYLGIQCMQQSNSSGFLLLGHRGNSTSTGTSYTCSMFVHYGDQYEIGTITLNSVKYKLFQIKPVNTSGQAYQNSSMSSQTCYFFKVTFTDTPIYFDESFTRHVAYGTLSSLFDITQVGTGYHRVSLKKRLYIWGKYGRSGAPAYTSTSFGYGANSYSCIEPFEMITYTGSSSNVLTILEGQIFYLYSSSSSVTFKKWSLYFQGSGNNTPTLYGMDCVFDKLHSPEQEPESSQPDKAYLMVYT